MAKLKQKYLATNGKQVHVIVDELNTFYGKCACGDFLDLRESKKITDHDPAMRCKHCAKIVDFDALPAKNKLKTAGKFEAITHDGKQLVVKMTVDAEENITVSYSLDGKKAEGVAEFSPKRSKEYYRQGCDYFVFLSSSFGLMRGER